MRFLILVVGAGLAFGQDADPGKLAFEARCARCHGGDGSGGDMGPNIRARLVFLNDPQLAKLFHEGSGAMPPVGVTEAELAPLTRFLRSLQPQNRPVVRTTARMTDGKVIDGELLNQGFSDLQMKGGDGRVHLLRRVGDRFREAEPGVDWPGYNGDPGGNRYTTLTGITKANVARLAPKWTFTLQGAGWLQGTPVVVGGIMYMPASNECYALDAGTGRLIWHYRIPGEKTGGTNRGVAVAGDRVFMQTEKAHLIALNRFTGELAWDTEMADWRQSYFATSAPLVAGGLVVAGIAGGEHGTRGFLAAYDPMTGKETWRFWTVPLPGEPKSET
jgi:alcohol dehydrogenase (cytochrome c)